MSLLLDAMKKSGEQGKGTGLTLEDHPHQSAMNAAPESAPLEASRAAGQTLFAAKKKKEPPRRRWSRRPPPASAGWSWSRTPGRRASGATPR